MNIHILLVDDNVSNRGIIEKFLIKFGYEVTQAESGQHALEVLDTTKRPIDLVLTDMMMPSMDGLELVENIKNRSTSLPVIMHTAHSSVNLALEFMKRGGADFIEKPIDYDVLNLKIKKAIELKKTTERLNDKKNELEQFTRTVAHDLKSPLNNIVSLIEFLEEDLEGKLDSDSEENFKLIKKSATNMRSLIQDLLDYAQVESTLEEKREPIDLNIVFKNLIESHQSQINDLGAIVNVGDLPTIRGEAFSIAQVFQNLLGNALKYNDSQNPEITVTAMQVGERWEISFSDNGIGIPEKDHAAIFRPFVRAHGSEQYEGTGIGLATVHKIIKRLGGDITVESTIGSGTTFYLTFI